MLLRVSRTWRRGSGSREQVPEPPPRFRGPLGDPLLLPCFRSWPEAGHGEVPAGSAPRRPTVLSWPLFLLFPFALKMKSTSDTRRPVRERQRTKPEDEAAPRPPRNPPATRRADAGGSARPSRAAGGRAVLQTPALGPPKSIPRQTAGGRLRPTAPWRSCRPRTEKPAAPCEARFAVSG